MLKFKSNNTELRTFSDTKFRVEWDSPLFSDELLPGVIVYTFEVPTIENRAIFGNAYERNAINLPQRYPAEVLWLDGSWMRGYLVLQRVSKHKYSVGFYFSALPEGFGDQYASSAMPTVDFYGKLPELLYAFASENQGAAVDYEIDGTVRHFTVDVQAPLLVAPSDADFFSVRNVKNDAGTMLGVNSYSDAAGIFNKKLISSSIYLKSAIYYVLGGYTIRGAWWQDAYFSELLILNSKLNNFTENQKKVRVRGHWQLYDDTDVHQNFYLLVADEIIGDQSLCSEGANGEFVYTPAEAGNYVVEYFSEKIDGQEIDLGGTGGEFDAKEYLSTKFIGEKLIAAHTPPHTMLLAIFLPKTATPPASFYVNWYLDVNFLQKPKQTIDLGGLLPEGYTKGDLLRNTLPALGALMLVDGETKEVELATAQAFATGPIIDLTAHMVDWYTEPPADKQRRYSFDQPTDHQATVTSGLLSALAEPQTTDLWATETATHSIYQSELVGGRIVYVRKQAERDVVNVGLAVEKNEISYSVRPAENTYLQDHFETWETGSDYQLAETVVHNGHLWGSNIANNASEPGANSDWEPITPEAVVPVVDDSTALVLAHFKGVRDASRICATASRYDKTGAALADTDLRMYGEDGIFEKSLKKTDNYRNQPITAIQLDGEVDIEALRKLFRPNGAGTNRPRRFRVGEVVYVPVQFSAVLTRYGVEDAQIKGVPA